MRSHTWIEVQIEVHEKVVCLQKFIQKKEIWQTSDKQLSLISAFFIGVLAN